MKDEPYVVYREEDDSYELHDPETNKSYWLTVEDWIDGPGKIELKSVKNYGVNPK